jgi:hypothetical protein
MGRVYIKSVTNARGDRMTDQTKVECKIFIAMNEDGGWIVCNDESEALTKLGEDEGGYSARVVKLTVKMTPPTIIETEVDVPDEAGETKEVEAEAA